MRSDSRLQALLAYAALLSLAGCTSSGWGLPWRRDADTPFRSFESVKAAYEEVVPGVSQTEDLIALRFDPKTNSSGFRLPFVAILHIFQPRPGIRLDEQPPEISGCLALRERCEVWDFQLERSRRHRIGNVLLDLLRFKRHRAARRMEAPRDLPAGGRHRRLQDLARDPADADRAPPRATAGSGTGPLPLTARGTAMQRILSILLVAACQLGQHGMRFPPAGQDR